jgi:MGT family glycosyltransferase
VATVAILNVAFDGHLAPAVRMGGALVQRGHRVLSWAPYWWRDTVEATGAAFRPQGQLRGPIWSPIGYAAALAEATDEWIEAIIEHLLAEGVDLVVHDCHAPWGRLAGDFLGLPRIASNPLFPLPEVGDAGDADDDDNRAEPLGTKEEAARVEASRLSLGRRWGVELGDWEMVTHNEADATLSYTTAAIVGGDDLRPGWRFAGPLLGPHPSETPAEEQPSVYVAFGTLFNTRVDVFRAVIDALASEPVDVLISTGRGGVSRADLGPLPSNVTVHEFVSSRQVLAHTTVHVTHGGCNSVHESLLAGVPMVCIPQGADQFAWSQRVEDLGVGWVVEPTVTQIRSVVQWLIRDTTTRTRARELGEHLARYDGAAVAGEVVERMLRGEGTY